MIVKGLKMPKVKSYQLQFIQHNQDQNVNLETLVEQFLFALHTMKYLFVSAASMYAFRVYRLTCEYSLNLNQMIHS